MEAFRIIGMPFRIVVVAVILVILTTIFTVYSLFAPSKGIILLQQTWTQYPRWAYDPKLEPTLFEDSGGWGDM